MFVSDASFGATTSKRNETLSEEYLANANPDYISPDKRIDSSTCVLPDTTWFLYNCEHNNFEDYTNNLIAAFIESNGQLTVKSNPEFPQFAILEEDGTVRPMTEDDVQIKNEDKTPRILKLIKSFFKLQGEIIKYLVHLIKK